MTAGRGLQRRVFAVLRERTRMTQESAASYLSDVTGRPFSRAQVGHYATGHDACPVDTIAHLVRHAADDDGDVAAVAQMVFGPLLQDLGCVVVRSERSDDVSGVLAGAMKCGTDLGVLFSQLTDAMADGVICDDERRRLVAQVRELLQTAHGILHAVENRPVVFRRGA